ncbi:MAG: hypothetical protein V2I97_16350 [Desulfococcaceae bacterium]|jgi:hypothetical protein|nr:hypothetical protein [Desulfococcaceae bacterium]
MFTVEGIYDGHKVEILGQIPFKGRKKILITFFEDIPEKTEQKQTDPIQALRGCAKNRNLTEKLLQSRKEDRVLEDSNRKYKKELSA